LSEYSGATPPDNEIKIKIEQKELQGRTYSQPNQWLGSEEDCLKAINYKDGAERRGSNTAEEQHYKESYRARSQSLIEEWRFDLIPQR
jgi:hypothetical protein